MMAWASNSVEIEMGALAGTSEGERLRTDFLVHAVTWPALIDLPEYDYSGDFAERWSVYREKFRAFAWSVMRFDRPSLIIGDILVCASRLQISPDGLAVERQYGVGLDPAERITVPLSPTVGLLLAKNPELSRLGAHAFNRTTIGTATEFVAHSPGWQDHSPELHSSMLAYIAEHSGSGSVNA